MKPRLRLLALSLCLIAGGAQAQTEAVTLTTGQDDPPFTDSNRADGGIATRLVFQIFHDIGVTTRLDWLPWRRGYSLTKSGAYQASFPYLKTAEREKDFLYSDILFTDFSYLWTRPGDPLSAAEPGGFRDRIICVPQGYHSPLLELLVSPIEAGEVKLERPDTPEKCVQMLAAGRVDALSGQEAEIDAPIQALGLAGRVVHGAKPLAKLDFYVIFSRENPNAADLIERFNTGLRRLKEDGRHAALMAR